MIADMFLFLVFIESCLLERSWTFIRLSSVSVLVDNYDFSFGPSWFVPGLCGGLL